MNNPLSYVKLDLCISRQEISQKPLLINKFIYKLYMLLLLLLNHFSHVRLCETPQTAATRLPCLWDSPGKNIGMGCHFLLQCVKMKSESEVTQSCPTLSYPMDRSLPGFSIHGIFQARVLEWVPLPSPINCIYMLQKSNVLKSQFCLGVSHICYIIPSFGNVLVGIW